MQCGRYARFLRMSSFDHLPAHAGVTRALAVAQSNVLTNAVQIDATAVARYARPRLCATLRQYFLSYTLSVRQVATLRQQFSIQDSRARGASNGVVDQYGEFEIGNFTGSNAPHDDRHSLPRITVATRLRPIRVVRHDDRMLGRGRPSPLL